MFINSNFLEKKNTRDRYVTFCPVLLQRFSTKSVWRCRSIYFNLLNARGELKNARLSYVFLHGLLIKKFNAFVHIKLADGVFGFSRSRTNHFVTLKKISCFAKLCPIFNHRYIEIYCINLSVRKMNCCETHCYRYMRILRMWINIQFFRFRMTHDIFHACDYYFS